MTALEKIVKRAKIIRKANPKITWQGAIKASSKEYNLENVTTPKKISLQSNKTKSNKNNMSKVGAIKTPIQYKGFTINYLYGEYRADSFADGQFTDKNIVKLKQKINEYLNPKKAVKKVGANKIKKAAVNFDILNGIIIFKAGNYYKIMHPNIKNDIIKITKIMKGYYYIDYYQYNNPISYFEPFKGKVTIDWLNEYKVIPTTPIPKSYIRK